MEGRSPWRAALRQLSRDRAAVAGLVLFAAIALFALAAPLWSEHVAQTGPTETHTTELVEVAGERREVVSLDGTPVGPLWFGAEGRFFLGADGRLGRDEMVRLMYGGRTSFAIAFGAALLATFAGLALALLAAYFRGWVDGLVSGLVDVVLSVPVLLLAIALGTALAVGGLDLGLVSIAGGSLAIPIAIIAAVYSAYLARPLRGEALSLRQQEFVMAAEAQGAGALRIMTREILPNLWPTVIVLFALTVGNVMLLESSLSFLGAGVQAPEASWGTMVAEGFEFTFSAPQLVLLPAGMVALTVIALNLIGDGLSSALNPRSAGTTERRASHVEARHRTA